MKKDHSSMYMEMSGNMLTGFLYCIMSVLIIVWILTTASSLFRAFSSRYVVCCLYGVFLALKASLVSLNRWDTPWNFI